MQLVAAGAAAIGTIFAGYNTLKGSTPKIQAAPVPAAREDAAVLAQRNDELRRRKGAAADLITGTRGAEAAAGSIGRLVLGS